MSLLARRCNLVIAGLKGSRLAEFCLEASSSFFGSGSKGRAPIQWMSQLMFEMAEIFSMSVWRSKGDRSKKYSLLSASVGATHVRNASSPSCGFPSVSHAMKT